MNSAVVVTTLCFMLQTQETDWPHRFPALDDAITFSAAAPHPISQTIASKDSVFYGTYLGAQGNDTGYGVALDANGEVYIVGGTDSIDWPALPSYSRSPTQSKLAGIDVCLSKIDPRTGALLRSARFGGSGTDIAYAAAVTSTGTILICGLTTSLDFGDHQNLRRDDLFDAPERQDYDAFLTEFDPVTGAIETVVFGGEQDDIALNVGVSPDGRVFVIGETGSPDFPTTSDAFDADFGGTKDVFVAQIASKVLVYSTFFGGFGDESAYDIALTEDRIIFVGRSSSPDLPMGNDAYDSTHNGSYDSYVAVLSIEGGLQASTYIGALRRDEAHGVGIDDQGSIYITGVARSEDFPVTGGAADTTHNGAYDGYVARFDKNLSRLEYSTFFGGFEHDVPFDLAVDEFNRAVVTGISFSPDMTTTPNALSSEFRGFSDNFLVVVDESGQHFSYASYLGGSSSDQGARIAIHENVVHIVGTTYSWDIQTSENACDDTWNGLADASLQSIPLTPAVGGYLLNYGQGWPGTDREPFVSARHPPMIGESLDLTVGSSIAPPTPSAGSLLIGVSAASIQTRLGGTLLVDPLVSVVVDLKSFEVPLNSRVPLDPNLIGLRAFMQLLVLDDGASDGIAFSRGLTLGFGSR